MPAMAPSRKTKRHAEPARARGPQAAPRLPGTDANRRIAWVTRAGIALIVFATLALVVYVRLRLAGVPLERDEGEYAYAGQLILKGIPPYALAYNMKFPGTYYAYAAVMAVFGQTAWGIRVGLLGVHVATVALVFALGRRLVGTLAAGIGASAFALLALDRWSMGVFAHATHFVLLPAVAGLFVLEAARRSGRAWHFVAAGVLVGLAIVMKQQALFFGVLAVGLAAWSDAGGPGLVARLVWRRGALVASGLAAAFGVLGVVLAAEGVLGRFWFWTFQYAAAYVSETPASIALDGVGHGVDVHHSGDRMVLVQPARSVWRYCLPCAGPATAVAGSRPGAGVSAVDRAGLLFPAPLLHPADAGDRPAGRRRDRVDRRSSGSRRRRHGGARGVARSCSSASPAPTSSATPTTCSAWVRRN